MVVGLMVKYQWKGGWGGREGLRAHSMVVLYEGWHGVLYCELCELKMKFVHLESLLMLHNQKREKQEMKLNYLLIWLPLSTSLRVN